METTLASYKHIERTDYLIAGALDALGEPLGVVKDFVKKFHGGSSAG